MGGARFERANIESGVPNHLVARLPISPPAQKLRKGGVEPPRSFDQ